MPRGIYGINPACWEDFFIIDKSTMFLNNVYSVAKVEKYYENKV